MIPKSGNRFSEKIMLARMSIARGYRLIALLALTLVGSAMPAHAQSDDERYSIMRPEKPEPWLAPKYKSPRGTRQHVVIPRPAPAPQRRTAVPPPIYVPQTGQVLPNLPAISGSGPGGAETYQDRAARCAHQAGVYGQAAGDRNAYVGSCINQ
jgi:hypothetical protein